MKTIQLTYPHNLLKNELPSTVCAFGFFDGIHKGHQKLIQKTMDLAKEKGMKSAVMTFHPHPTDVLQKQSEPMKYITPLKQKEAILKEMGIDCLYIVTFNHGLASLPPHAFIDHFIEQLHIKHVVGGFDYSFGHKGKGTMETMKNEARGRYDTSIIPKMMQNNTKISSTSIRTWLQQGKVDYLLQIMGRLFAVEGHVVSGEKRGRTIGFPTANIACEPDALLPTVGVYAVTMTLGKETFYGMANIGYKPTFHQDLKETTLEVYLFDFDRDIYGEQVCVSFHTFIRDEKAFEGVDALIAQLTNDAETVRGFFQER